MSLCAARHVLAPLRSAACSRHSERGHPRPPGSGTAGLIARLRMNNHATLCRRNLPKVQDASRQSLVGKNGSVSVSFQRFLAISRTLHCSEDALKI